MTGDTGFSGSAVIKHRHRPIHRGVAGVAGRRRHQMCCAHAGGDYPIMATRTGAIHLGVIYRGHWCPTHRRVTGVTLIRTIDMSRYRFAGGDHTVMTALTSTLHFVVVDGARRTPCRRGVTAVTDVTGIHVSGGFSTGDHAIVAGLADRHIGDLGMIHRTRRHPGGTGMTGLASRAGINMCR